MQKSGRNECCKVVLVRGWVGNEVVMYSADEWYHTYIPNKDKEHTILSI
jgi:hypothetical protein